MLSKKQDARPAPSPMAGSTFSVFGPDVVMKGDLTASADLHIDGKVEGDISCAALVQGEASEITGNVQAATARLAGTIRGTVAAEQLVIQKSARIDGKLNYRGKEPVLTLAGGTQAI